MTTRKPHTGGAGSSRRPAADHKHEAPKTSGPDLHVDEAVAGGAAFDPELELDLGAELELAQKQATEHLALAQHVQAEFENYRKRVTRDAADQRQRATERLVEALLPAIDNLERAIEHTTAGGDLADLLRGVELVHQQVLDVLGKEGVELLDPQGKQFDPAEEQAVQQREDTSVPEGTVVDVFQKGYRMGGRCLRPAMVVVSTGGPHPPKE